jgi:acyl-CoA-dependent ceramide synthase
MLKYFGFETICNWVFGMFMIVWFVARHVIYPSLCWSIYKNVPKFMAYGCYSGVTGELLTTNGNPDAWAHRLGPFRDINGPICMNPGTKGIFLSFLLFLQVLSIAWFTMIIGVAVRVLRTGEAEDSRSDAEDEVEVEGAEDGFANGTIGRETAKGSAMIHEGSRSGSEHAWRKSNGSTQVHPVRIRTGRGRVRLSDQSDRKALLGRIGCDKPT